MKNIKNEIQWYIFLIIRYFFLIDGIEKCLPKNEKNGILLMEFKSWCLSCIGMYGLERKKKRTASLLNWKNWIGKKAISVIMS